MSNTVIKGYDLYLAEKQGSVAGIQAEEGCKQSPLAGRRIRQSVTAWRDKGDRPVAADELLVQRQSGRVAARAHTIHTRAVRNALRYTL